MENQELLIQKSAENLTEYIVQNADVNGDIPCKNCLSTINVTRNMHIFMFPRAMKFASIPVCMDCLIELKRQYEKPTTNELHI